MTSVARTCEVPGCGRTARARGLCSTHYQRHLKGRSVYDYAIKAVPEAGECSVRGCTDTGRTRGMCSFHYLRFYNGLPLDTPRVDTRRYRGRSCLLSQCSNRAGGARGLCKSHSNWAGKYKFSPLQAIQILNSGYPCDICGVRITSETVNVDHDHSCCPGQDTCGECLRGILCRSCNRGLGSFGDDISSIRRVLQYLENAGAENRP